MIDLPTRIRKSEYFFHALYKEKQIAVGRFLKQSLPDLPAVQKTCGAKALLFAVNISRASNHSRRPSALPPATSGGGRGEKAM